MKYAKKSKLYPTYAVEVLRYGVSTGTIPSSSYVIYYDHKGEYHDTDKKISDFIELRDFEKIVIKVAE